MRIPSGVTDQYIYFVAVDSTDFTTRETGLSSFTVYRSRNGGVAAVMTTPTINETDTTNMPGVYELLLDEDMTIDAGDDTQEMCFHITHAGMAPVTRVIELYRPKITAGNTLGVASDGDISGNLDGTVATVTTLTGHTAQTGDSYARLGAPAGASVSFDIAAINSDTNNIQTRLPATLVSGRILANVGAINDNTTVVTNLEDDYDGVTGYNKSLSTIGTVTNVSDKTGYALSAAGIDSIWDELVTGHVTASSFAVAVTDILNDTATSGVVVADKTGFSLAADQSGVTIGTESTLTGHTAQTGDSFARLGAPAGASISADIAALPTDADVNAQVVDVLKTDTITEQSQGAPPSAPTFEKAISYLYMMLVNKVTQDGSNLTLFDNAGTTAICKSATTDAAGTFTRATMITGA